MTLSEFALLREPQAFEGLEEAEIQNLLETYKPLANVIIRKLETYFDADTFNLMTNNLVLHYFIVQGVANTELTSPQGYLVDKYDISSKSMDFIVNSVSNSSSSVSIQDFSSLSNSKFLLQDLIRTPYGQYVYTLLETLQGIAVVLL